MTTQTLLPVAGLVERLARKEQALKNAGAYAEAAGIRDAVVVILRMADEPPAEAQSLDSTGEPS